MTMNVQGPIGEVCEELICDRCMSVLMNGVLKQVLARS